MREMSLLFLEDFAVGRSFSSPPYHVSKEEVVSFARVWDPQLFHVDEDAAAASIYGGIIACSAHIFSIFTRLSSQAEPRSAALGALGFDEMRIPRPLRAGDTVRLTTECIEMRRSRSKPDRGIISSRVRLENQRGEVVFSAITTFMIRARTPAGA
jgi:acyl dehydratase